MSQQEELNEYKLKELTEKAITEGRQEARLILKLELDYDNNKPRNSRRIYYKVVDGEIREIEGEKIYDGNRTVQQYIIVPLSSTVVIITYDMEGPVELFVFSAKKGGWYKLYI